MDIEDLVSPSASTRVDVLVIGAGVVGVNVAHALCRLHPAPKVLVVDALQDVSLGASRANSGIVHGGYDAKHGTLKGAMERKGNRMFGPLAKSVSAPYKETGSLVLSFTEADDAALEALIRNGVENGFRRDELEMWSGEQVLAKEPHVSVGVRRALHCKTAGITSPYLFTIALAESCVANGVEFRFRFQVASVARAGQLGYVVRSTDGTVVHAKQVVSCAGVFADSHAVVPAGKPDRAFLVKPRKGEYILLAKTQGHLASRVLFQTPTERWGKGVLVTPTVDGNLLLGPSATDSGHRTDVSTSLRELAYVAWASRRSVPHLDTRQAIRSFAGVRAKSNTGDFIVSAVDAGGFVLCAGIDSPGLTASPALALEVLRLLGKSAPPPLDQPRPGWIVREHYKGSGFVPEGAEFEHPDPRLNIICRCERVTEETIVDSLQRGLPVTCTDSVKWRTRAGMGECQGRRCKHLVAGLVAQETGVSLEEALKGVCDTPPVRVDKESLSRL